MDLLGRWAQVPSGRDYFGDAKYAGSEACKSCHEQQFADWRETWHSKILRDADSGADVVIGAFDGKPVQFKDVRAATSYDGNPGALENPAVDFVVRPERRNGKFVFVIVDPKNPNSSGQEYVVTKVVGGKWQQTYHVNPKRADGTVMPYFFPAPLRWAVTPDPSATQKGSWELSNFQPESWILNGPQGVVPRDSFRLPVARFAEAKCMGCHTTGFEFAFPDNTNKDGKHWEMRGNGQYEIGCERCHGPGEKHIAYAKKIQTTGKLYAHDDPENRIVHGLADLSLDQQSQVCGQCHSRIGGVGNQTDLAFPNVHLRQKDDTQGSLFLPGDTDLRSRSLIWSYEKPYGGAPPGRGVDNFWPAGPGKKSRTQWQDYASSAHATKGGPSCITCHSFHGEAVNPSKRAERQQQSKLRQPVKELCETCHTTALPNQRPNVELYAGSFHAVVGRVECVDCHMDALGQRMTKTAQGEAAFDVSYHGVKITLASIQSSAQVLSGTRESCQGCHTDLRAKPGGSVPPARSADELIQFLQKVQTTTRNDVEVVLKQISQSQRKDDAQVALWHKNAHANLDMILRDGSMGAHSATKDGILAGGAGECLRLAKLWVALACQKAGATCDPKPPATTPPPPPAVCFSSP
jgi:hypothetical protein